MAAIDKIYGTREQKEELGAWLQENIPIALRYIYPDPDYERFGEDKSYPISNFPSWVDRALWDWCPIEFVRTRLREQYHDIEEQWGNEDDIRFSWSIYDD